MFRVVFVMDMFNGNVVLAKGGVREKYHPVSNSSNICKDSDPLQIIEALNPKEVYIADLNRLQGTGPSDINVEIIKKVSLKTNIMLDFGISSLEDVGKALSIAGTAVIGTETGNLSMIKQAAFENPGKISVSIDMKRGAILKKDPEIPEKPLEIVEILNSYPIKELIFLDLERVGAASGFDPEFLRKLVETSKHNVLLAGGVRNLDDLIALKKIGIKGALVASALHSGLISVDTLTSSLKI